MATRHLSALSLLVLATLLSTSMATPNQKKAMCRGKPEKVMNGVWPDDCRDNAPGAVCPAVCKMDAWSWYNKKGVPTSTCCPDGKWSKPEHPSFCHKQRAPGCLGSPAPSGHSTFNCGPSSAAGTVCTATCDAGYVPAPGGAPTATCLAGPKHGVPVTWSAATGACNIACVNNPANPANGIFACPSPLLPGKECSASCNDGFQGEPIATCQADGTYGSVSGACEQAGTPCTAAVNPPYPDHGYFSCGQYNPGGKCMAFCDTGYRPSPTAGRPEATCQPDGTYGPVTGACVPIPN